MSSPHKTNFHEFQSLCQAQIEGKDWMKDWPGSVDCHEAARALRPLALKFKAVDSLSDDEVLGTFLSAQAVQLLQNMRNMYCFWVIVMTAAKHIGDYSSTISLPNVVTAMEERPDIKKALRA